LRDLGEIGSQTTVCGPNHWRVQGLFVVMGIVQEQPGHGNIHLLTELQMRFPMPAFQDGLPNGVSIHCNGFADQAHPDPAHSEAQIGLFALGLGQATGDPASCRIE
jgi:hypothetical protein